MYYVILQLDHIMSCGNVVHSQKFGGTSDNLDSFFLQFHIACQLNRWPERDKAY